MLWTDHWWAGIDGADFVPNKNRSHAIRFGPEAPERREGNRIQTMPGKGGYSMPRFHGPWEPWFYQTWQTGDFDSIA